MCDNNNKPQPPKSMLAIIHDQAARAVFHLCRNCSNRCPDVQEVVRNYDHSILVEKARDQRGFTMVEASVVIAVMGVVTAFFIAFVQPVAPVVKLANQVVASDKEIAADLQKVVDQGQLKEGARVNPAMIAMIERQAGGEAKRDVAVVETEGREVERVVMEEYPKLIQEINSYLAQFGNFDFGALYSEFLSAIGATEQDVAEIQASKAGDLAPPAETVP